MLCLSPAILGVGRKPKLRAQAREVDGDSRIGRTIFMQISRQISGHCAGLTPRHISTHASKQSIRRSGPAKSRRRETDGFIITLVAIFLLFVVGAMAALSIDVVTFYTARSEAQLAADSGALAGARVLANSGATSDSSGNTFTAAQLIAGAVATQVAESNSVGGQPLLAGNISVSFNGNNGSPCPQAQQVSEPMRHGANNNDRAGFFRAHLGQHSSYDIGVRHSRSLQPIWARNGRVKFAKYSHRPELRETVAAAEHRPNQQCGQSYSNFQ